MTTNGSDQDCVGTVKWFNDQKGFGFITRDVAPDVDVFVHHTAIRMDGFRTLRQGEAVSFELLESDKGLQARNVTRAS